MNTITTRTDAVRAAEMLLSKGGRRILGLAGAPGSGKSTLASVLADALGTAAMVVPMDGFHLAQCELERLGRAGRKGAPDTFDAAGFVSLLRRLRDPVPGETVYAPAFRREIEEPIAGAIAVPAEVPLLIVEGNYLLLDGPWSPVRGLLDESWFVATDEALRAEWLLARHMRFGRDRAAALDWIARTDEPNARVIAASAGQADRRVVLGGAEPAR
ncbi:nucleoside/nucleotide kinase family protein [Acetobacteraceae bacterium KSS8]|uniref:Nucleoside/nucleotide kinase family protein n=1 Tax=Endosaccharibacter trunci TaxID=2812733 RepID=A0ABT1W9P1_9PROT|nr:nucleoside/nucleotide kinase family protein [Acetobacteraceae bacterium KSS8]